MKRERTPDWHHDKGRGPNGRARRIHCHSSRPGRAKSAAPEKPGAGLAMNTLADAPDAGEAARVDERHLNARRERDEELVEARRPLFPVNCGFAGERVPQVGDLNISPSVGPEPKAQPAGAVEAGIWQGS